jgi:hypothetical protein
LTNQKQRNIINPDLRPQTECMAGFVGVRKGWDKRCRSLSYHAAPATISGLRRSCRLRIIQKVKPVRTCVRESK